MQTTATSSTKWRRPSLPTPPPPPAFSHKIAQTAHRPRRRLSPPIPACHDPLRPIKCTRPHPFPNRRSALPEAPHAASAAATRRRLSATLPPLAASHAPRTYSIAAPPHSHPPISPARHRHATTFSTAATHRRFPVAAAATLSRRHRRLPPLLAADGEALRRQVADSVNWPPTARSVARAFSAPSPRLPSRSSATWRPRRRYGACGPMSRP